MRLHAPAKLNFGLRVVGRRDDGYHRIESLFVPLALGDRVELRIGEGPEIALRITGDAPELPADASNLAWRAARAFLDAAGRDDGVEIALEKRIPAAAGLGGGSSDAAAVLRGLATLCPGALDEDALARVALSLGADVPFFLDPRPALVSGIGEVIDPLAAPFPEQLGRLALLLVHPGTGLSTAEVYAAYDAENASLTPAGAAYSLSGLSALSGESGPAELARLLENDLEAVVCRLCPAIAQLREALARAGARAVGMSGSGPTVYGIFQEEAEARQTGDRLGTHAARSWVTTVLSAAG